MTARTHEKLYAHLQRQVLTLCPVDPKHGTEEDSLIEFYKENISDDELKISPSRSAIQAIEIQRDLTVGTVNDEARRLMKEIIISIEEVQQSRFYATLTQQIRSDAFQHRLVQVLGSHSQMPMVIYALGSLEFCFEPHRQLAVAILLRRDFPQWIGGIEVYDPIFSPSDIVVLKELGCDVISTNEWCRRSIVKPTLFYLPYFEFDLLGNLLAVNWSPSQLNQMIILGNNLDTILPILNPAILEGFREVSKIYIIAIQDFMKKIAIENYGDGDVIGDFAWHFFEVDYDLDMLRLLPEFLLVPNRRIKLLGLYDLLEPSNFKELLEAAENSFMAAFRKNVDDDDDDNRLQGRKPHRAPRKYRLVSKPPASGWIKLRICGRGAGGEDGDHVPAGFGGICYNDRQFPILIYYGSLGEVDENIACLKALEVGLESLKDSSVDDLIVEGDNFRVIQWVNDSPEPPEVVEQSLDSISFLLADFNSVVYHIYEEANVEAIQLAEKGAVSCPIGKPEILFLEHLASILKPGEIEDENDTEEEENTEVTEMGEDTEEEKAEENTVETEEEEEEEEDTEEIVEVEEREETEAGEDTEENKEEDEVAAEDRAGPIWGFLSGLFKCFSDH